MRLQLFLILFFGLFSVTVFSQGFNGGLFAGISASQISGDNLSGFDKPGFSGGGFVNLNFGKNSGMQMELSYIGKGSRKLAKPDEGDPIAYKLTLDYIELPLLYKYLYKDLIGVDIGPYFSVLISSKEEDENGGISPIAEFEKFDFGGLISLYYKINDNWMFDIRISTSLTKVREHGSGSTDRLNKGQYNNVLMFSFRYQFNKAK